MNRRLVVWIAALLESESCKITAHAPPFHASSLYGEKSNLKKYHPFWLWHATYEYAEKSAMHVTVLFGACRSTTSSLSTNVTTGSVCGSVTFLLLSWT